MHQPGRKPRRWEAGLARGPIVDIADEGEDHTGIVAEFPPATEMEADESQQLSQHAVHGSQSHGNCNRQEQQEQQTEIVLYSTEALSQFRHVDLAESRRVPAARLASITEQECRSLSHARLAVIACMTIKRAGETNEQEQTIAGRQKANKAKTCC